jgi:hypothetical protein
MIRVLGRGVVHMFSMYIALGSNPRIKVNECMRE